MPERSVWINPHSLTVVVLTAAALLSRMYYPMGWALLDSGELLQWPQLLLSMFFLILWVVVWLHSRRHGPINPLLALGTLGLIIQPLIYDLGDRLITAQPDAY